MYELCRTQIQGSFDVCAREWAQSDRLVVIYNKQLNIMISLTRLDYVNTFELNRELRRDL